MIKTDELQLPLRMLSNRVFRSYRGGKLLETWQGVPDPKDGLQPEEWLASTVEARNSKTLAGEGLSTVKLMGKSYKLVDLINSDPEYYLSAGHVEKFGPDLALLTKVLDASVRLSLQVHPTKAYSQKFFGSKFGKTEAWYIINGREIAGEKPYVLLGFKPGVTIELWKTYFQEQNIEAMLSALHKFEVEAGDVILIEGGIPHAIGAGCFLVEIQEPTDYTLRVERKTCDGAMLPDFLCHQGLGFDAMLECFNYSVLTYEETRRKCFKILGTHLKDNGDQLIPLISEQHTTCFTMDKLSVLTSMSITIERFKTCIILSGKGWIGSNGNQIPVQQGEIYFLPAYFSHVDFTNEGDEFLECILCSPPALI